MRPTAPALLIAALIAGPAQALDARITLIPALPAPLNSAIGPSWSPTAAQADEALAFLAGYLAHLDQQTGLNNIERSDYQAVRARFPNYRYQAYGATAPAGNNWPGLAGERARVVMLNAACDQSSLPSRPEWKTARLPVADGGPCYFRLFYDIDKKRLAWLSVNGEA